jgi:hypothetical protein
LCRRTRAGTERTNTMASAIENDPKNRKVGGNSPKIFFQRLRWPHSSPLPLSSWRGGRRIGMLGRISDVVLRCPPLWFEGSKRELFRGNLPAGEEHTLADGWGGQSDGSRFCQRTLDGGIHFVVLLIK